MTFPPEFLDEVRNRVPLPELVGRRVRLSRRGREHLGLCPFHNEKTPSFTVSEDKGFFHCFGCGAHGDAVGFVMRSEGLSFPEAVERLAGEAGLQVPRASPAERAAAQRRSGLLEVVEAAAAWYEAQLRGPAGSAARDYLRARGLRGETIAAFRLGYAPDRRGLLRSSLNARGIDDGQLVEAGLLKRPEDGGAPREYFFDRVVFPITDRRGRVIAFGGRALGDSNAKYINSPDTPLFHKGRVLYNLARARQAALEGAELILAEGYMDVIALGQAGFPAAVAPLGTAVTEEQIAELWRLAPEPILCLDGDAAGRRAAQRAAERALGQLAPGRSLRFAALPAGEDPDSLLRGGNSGALRAVLDAAQPLFDLLWGCAVEGRRFDTPERQAGLIKALDEQIGRIADGAVQRAYREALGRRFQAAFGYAAWGPAGGGAGPGFGGAWPRRWRRSLPRSWDRRAARSPAPTQLGPVAGARPAESVLLRRQDQVLLAALVNHPVIITEHAEELAGLGFASAEYSAFCQEMVDVAARDPDLDTASLKRHLSGQGYSGILGELLRPEVYLHGGYARPTGSRDEARRGVRASLESRYRRQTSLEAEEAGRALAEEMTEEALARLEAKQRLIQESETRRSDLEPLDGASPADSTDLR